MCISALVGAPNLFTKPMETPTKKEKRKKEAKIATERGEERGMHLPTQGIPVRKPVSDVIASGVSPFATSRIQQVVNRN